MIPEKLSADRLLSIYCTYGAYALHCFLLSNQTAATMTTTTLKTVIFLGSARNITPPWGGDSRKCSDYFFSCFSISIDRE